MNDLRIASLFPSDAAVSVCVADRAMYDGELFAPEAALVANAVAKRREEFTAGRNAARAALARFDLPAVPLLQTGRRAPAWPPGSVGSITHCHGFCCAVVALSTRVRSLGIDAEAGEPLTDELTAMVCTPDELAHFATLPGLATSNWPKLAFCAKEAFYKCIDPVVGTFLDFPEADVRFRTYPTSDGGEFTVLVRQPAIAAQVPPSLVSGRWAIDDNRVYAGAAWPPD